MTRSYLSLTAAALLASSLVFSPTLKAEDDYKLGPDSQKKEGVPTGKVVTGKLTNSKIFPGTERDYAVYVPAQYDPAKPACLMVFQDGMGYVSEKSGWRVPIAFDNLIAAKEMPVTIAVFVNPGVVPPPNKDALPRFNRSLEYDGLGDRYARFLIEELLPEVEKDYKISADPNDHAIAGSSSGAIAAFNAAWERPDAFRRVFSTIGTFVDLRGGNVFPTFIRKFEPRPLRVYLQDGSHDLNIYGGDWFLANQTMLSAFEFSGYEVNHQWGDGGHNGKQGGSIMPDALRWLWKDWPKPVATHLDISKQQPLKDVIDPGEDWQTVEGDFKSVDGPAVNTKGEVFFSDMGVKKIFKIGLDGKVSHFVDTPALVSGMEFGPDGKLYCTSGAMNKLIRYTPEGKMEEVADGVGGNDLCIRKDGTIYVTLTKEKSILRVTPDGKKDIVAKNIGSANGIGLSPDQSLLYVSDYEGAYVWSLQVQADGTLTNFQPYFHLHLKDGVAKSAGDGLTVDARGWLYVTSEMGLQVCDQAGRVNFILRKPLPATNNVVFAGKDLDTLFITAGDKIFKRKTKVKGFHGYGEPFKPAPPKL